MTFPTDPTFLRGPDSRLPLTPRPPQILLKSAPNPPRCEKNAIQDAYFLSSLLGCLLRTIFMPFWVPTCFPKPIKIHRKSMLRGHPSWASIVNGFLIGFWCQLQPHNLEKSLKIHLFYSIVCKIGLSKLASVFDPILVPTCLHFPSKTPSKMHYN